MVSTNATLRRPAWARAVLAALAILSLASCVATGQGGTTASPGRAADGSRGQGTQTFSVAAGSAGEIGLLAALATEFAKTHPVKVSWYQASPGQAMKMLQDRQVDMVFAHAPAAERKAVAEGWATGRRLIGSNEFWIIGPARDPARIVGLSDPAEAFRRIQDSGAKFVSRGDNSGPHQKELEIWKAAGRTPGGPNYIVNKDATSTGMPRANAENAYFLTDSSTYVAESHLAPQLRPWVKGGPLMINPYHTLYPSRATAGAESARKFGEFLASPRAQALIRSFGQSAEGVPMYNDAATTAAFVKD